MQSGLKTDLNDRKEMISSSDDNCEQLVAGNYDVIINESATESMKQVLTDYLEHFQHHEQELLLQMQQQQSKQQNQHQQQQQQNDQPVTSSYVNEFKLLKELSKALKEDRSNLEIGEKDFNQKKNRYKDIIPFSHTRVILQDIRQQGATTAGLSGHHGGEGSCYINANYIRGPSGSPRAYIACQGPLPNTLMDFWRMIWECNVSVVIMACNEFESGKPKCELYWSDQIESSQIYGNIQVTLLRVRQINSDFLIRKFSVKLLAPESRDTNHRPNFEQNLMQQNGSVNIEDDKHQGCHQPPSRIGNNQQSNTVDSMDQRPVNVTPPLLDRNSFPLKNDINGNFDHSPPINSRTSCESLNTASDTASATSASTTNIRTNSIPSSAGTSPQSFHQPRPRVVLAERTICQFHYTTWPDHGVPDSVGPILELVRLVREVQPTEEKPILVHCSAGCGRTGTICCIDYVWGLLRLGKLDNDFSLCRIIGDMRQQRMAMVQTIEQYILCHRAVAALFIEQLQLIDGHLAALGISNDCNEEDFNVKNSALDDKPHSRDNVNSESSESEDDMGPVFI